MVVAPTASIRRLRGRSSSRRTQVVAWQASLAKLELCGSTVRAERPPSNNNNNDNSNSRTATSTNPISQNLPIASNDWPNSRFGFVSWQFQCDANGQPLSSGTVTGLALFAILGRGGLRAKSRILPRGIRYGYLSESESEPKSNRDSDSESDGCSSSSATCRFKLKRLPSGRVHLFWRLASFRRNNSKLWTNR